MASPLPLRLPWRMDFFFFFLRGFLLPVCREGVRGTGGRGLARPADVDETLFGNNNYRETRDMGKYSVAGCRRRRRLSSFPPHGLAYTHGERSAGVCKFANTRKCNGHTYVYVHTCCVQRDRFRQPMGEHRRAKERKRSSPAGWTWQIREKLKECCRPCSRIVSVIER